MLNKRAHILFDEDLWNKLLKMAKQENTSVGKVVRSAVEEKISKEKESERRIKAVDSILELRKHIKKAKKEEDSVNIIRKMRKERTKHLLSLINHK